MKPGPIIQQKGIKNKFEERAPATAVCTMHSRHAPERERAVIDMI